MATGTTTIVDVWWTTATEGGGVLPSSQIVVPLLTEKKYGPLSIVVGAGESVGVALAFSRTEYPLSARGFRVLRRPFVMNLRDEGKESNAAGHHVLLEPTFAWDGRLTSLVLSWGSKRSESTASPTSDVDSSWWYGRRSGLSLRSGSG